MSTALTGHNYFTHPNSLSLHVFLVLVLAASGLLLVQFKFSEGSITVENNCSVQFKYKEVWEAFILQGDD